MGSFACKFKANLKSIKFKVSYLFAPHGKKVLCLEMNLGNPPPRLSEDATASCFSWKASLIAFPSLFYNQKESCLHNTGVFNSFVNYEIGCGFPKCSIHFLKYGSHCLSIYIYFMNSPWKLNFSISYNCFYVYFDVYRTKNSHLNFYGWQAFENAVFLIYPELNWTKL